MKRIHDQVDEAELLTKIPPEALEDLRNASYEYRQAPGDEMVWLHIGANFNRANPEGEIFEYRVALEFKLSRREYDRIYDAGLEDDILSYCDYESFNVCDQ